MAGQEDLPQAQPTFGGAALGAIWFCPPANAVPIVFKLIAATVITSNQMRVFFSEEPVHRSVLGANDALNRVNWAISVLSGPATIPVVEQVENAQAQPNLFTDFPTAWSVDLRTDRPLIELAEYLVVAAQAIGSLAGPTMAAPPNDRVDPPGIVLPPSRVPPTPPSSTSGIDFFYDTFTGVYRLDSKQDIDVHSGDDAVKKRIIRRILSTPGSFFHLPNYGVGLRVKQNFSTTRIALIRGEVERQVRQEEEVQDVSVTVSLLGSLANVLLISLIVKTKAQQNPFSLEFQVPSVGAAVVRLA